MLTTRAVLVGLVLAAPDGVSGLNYAAFGLGYAILVLALTQVWRLYREVRKERDFYRDKFWGMAGVAEASTSSSLQLVQAEKESDAGQRARLLREAFKTIVEAEKATG